MAFNEDSSASGHDEPWIQWFCKLKGHEMFCEVERSYIEDGFNLYGLRACVSNFSDCLDLILDRIGPDDSDDSHLTQSACTLYGLIHARYIITAHGLDAMYNKYAAKDFGSCALIQCSGQPVLPVGLKDEMGADAVKIYCPKCHQVYHPPPVRSRASNGSGVDGAAFGTTFPHLFLMTFSNLVPDPLPVEATYVPRVFGFRVHKSARQRTSSATANANAAANAVVTATANANAALAVTANANTNERVVAENANASAAVTTSNSLVALPAATNESTTNGDTNTNSNNKNEELEDIPESAAVMAGVQAHVQVPVQPVAATGATEEPELGEEDDDKKQKSRQGKRGRKEATETKKPEVANGVVTGGPTFLMENPVKRRRRNNGST